MVNLKEIPWYVHLISASLYIHILVYLGISYRVLHNYREIIKNKFSKIDHINLPWLSFAIKTFALITIVSLLHNFLVLSGDVIGYSISLIGLLLFIFYFVNRVIFKALKQPEIFAGISHEDTVKYSGSYLTHSQLKHYEDELVTLLRKEQLYLNPQLSLAELAELLTLSSKNLSQVINQSFGKNFYDLINSFRIEEAKKVMTQSKDEKLTVLEVMYQVGFNSKSSFNTAFKKETGQTPTEFKKSL